MKLNKDTNAYKVMNFLKNNENQYFTSEEINISTHVWSEYIPSIMSPLLNIGWAKKRPYDNRKVKYAFINPSQPILRRKLEKYSYEMQEYMKVREYRGGVYGELKGEDLWKEAKRYVLLYKYLEREPLYCYLCDYCKDPLGNLIIYPNRSEWHHTYETYEEYDWDDLANPDFSWFVHPQCYRIIHKIKS